MHDPLPVASEVSEAVALGQGWNLDERRGLQAKIAARQPFLDYALHRQLPDGSQQQFRVSGQPLFDTSCRFIGYRGVGVAVTEGH
jgi:hypothetical protein